MQTDKKVSLTQYCKLGITNKSRDTLIRMLKKGNLPENVAEAEKVGETYLLTLKQAKNGK